MALLKTVCTVKDCAEHPGTEIALVFDSYDAARGFLAELEWPDGLAVIRMENRSEH